jgi:putative Mn2+ efflux pump MntP
MAVPSAALIPLVLSLSLDTFAVSTAVGIAPLAPTVRLRFAACCALAEGLMPLLGVALGSLLGRVERVADWAAVALLLGAGLWTAREALEDEDEVAEALVRAEHGGLTYLLAALAVSLDELAVGLAAGALRLPLLPVVLAISIQALLASLLGLWLGGLLGRRAGARAALLAAAALCATGIWVAIGALMQ